jgi:ribose transport system permease protein
MFDRSEGMAAPVGQDGEHAGVPEPEREGTPRPAGEGGPSAHGAPAAVTGGAARQASAGLAGWGWRLGLRRLSGVYGLLALIIAFSLLEPSLFPTRATVNLVLSDQALAGFLALAVLVPLTAGALDISIANVAGFSAVLSAWLSINTHWNDAAIVALVIALCGLFGLGSGLMVAWLQLNSIVVTLGMSSVALGITEFIAGGNTLSASFGPTLNDLGQNSLGFFPVIALILAALAIVLHVWMEHTASGRFARATGSNLVAARLAGVRVARIQLMTLVASAVIAGIAGILMTANVESVSSVTAGGYLLPAIAAVFLGSTQFRGRPGVAGTVLAVFLLGVIIKGLQLEGAQSWVSDFFDGAVLLAAVAVSSTQQRSRIVSLKRRLRWRRLAG